MIRWRKVTLSSWVALAVSLNVPSTQLRLQRPHPGPAEASCLCLVCLLPKARGALDFVFKVPEWPSLQGESRPLPAARISRARWLSVPPGSKYQLPTYSLHDA